MGATANLPEQPAEPKQNLKVFLKNISNEDLRQVMGQWSRALGVRCNFCHSASATDPKKLDFTSDAKPEKEIARQTYTMTEQINKKYFHIKKGENSMMVFAAVNCNTCHHGEAHPEVKEEKMMR
ncbi:MAG: c-type cytochrome [Sphingobacteriaceae bacterium]|nr:MAG: c-type cytochrome [Sphingobacteriaceae bacterium]